MNSLGNCQLPGLHTEAGLLYLSYFRVIKMGFRNQEGPVIRMIQFPGQVET